jgi:hypothetical protein
LLHFAAESVKLGNQNHHTCNKQERVDAEDSGSITSPEFVAIIG